MKTDFTKMQGLGNDFVVLLGPVEFEVEQIAKICDRHRGIGADGLLVVTSIDRTHVDMKYYNADGSVAEMCGNGLRCVTKFAVDSKLVQPGVFKVNTDAGTLEVNWDGNDHNHIETQIGKATSTNKPLMLRGFDLYEANVGNPHAVIFVDDVISAPVASAGPKIETDSHFPNKTNVEFVQVVNKNKLSVRVWERGVGETQACATGMVAAASVATKLDKTQWPVDVTVPGGTAKIWLDHDGYVRMTGPAQTIFSGTIVLR